MTTTLRVRFDGKVLIPEEPVDLPVGTPLEMRVAPEPDSPFAELKRLAEQMTSAVDRGPVDGAAQHNHYLYGAPKQP